MKDKTKKLFGKFRCDDEVLKKYMTFFHFKRYLNIKANGGALDSITAQSVAKAAKNWAIDCGATHYTHWFLPLNGKTAEKQVSFMDIDSKGHIIEELSESTLIKGETDASSFPNGGERMTFEARGYTIWDYTSPMFIKEDSKKNRVLYIPTAFCSYSGISLDEKTPLLRSNEALNIQALRVLAHMGYEDVKKVVCNVGAEQEYFLIKKEDYDNRIDLKMTGRTLFGHGQTKSQEVHSHYFCAIDDEISDFMNQVDKKLWAMGVAAKLQHNEAAPSQHEIVPIYASSNIASDQNQIIMETISKVAKENGLIALFHEKPFKDVNGSGKHLNWSLSTDTGINLFDMNMEDSLMFLLFFSATVSAVDEFNRLLRSSTACRGNDFRLGGEEAPPALLSLYIGDELEKIIYSDELSKKSDSRNCLDTRVKSLPKTIKDICDRNRTSPFAFSGNKFEFRMVGSSQSVAWPCTCLNVAYAKVLGDIADKLDASKSSDKRKEIKKIIRTIFEEHKRIIFNGNGYEESWRKEAGERGLEEMCDSSACFNTLDEQHIVDSFETMGVLTLGELKIRKNALIKNYIEAVEVEAKTMCEMLTRQIFPSMLSTMMFYKQIFESCKNNNCQNVYNKILNSYNIMFNYHHDLTQALTELKREKDANKKADLTKNIIIPKIDFIRDEFDGIEELIPDDKKPFPNYNDILFNFD